MWSNTSSSDAIRAPSIGFPECHSAPSSRHPWENRTALMRACERLGQCPKVIRVADVVLAHERDEASAGVPDAEIAGGGYALVRLLKQADRTESGIFRNDGRTAVNRTVIDDNNFSG